MGRHRGITDRRGALFPGSFYGQLLDEAHGDGLALLPPTAQDHVPSACAAERILAPGNERDPSVGHVANHVGDPGDVRIAEEC
jgi:hypothetical protein